MLRSPPCQFLPLIPMVDLGSLSIGIGEILCEIKDLDVNKSPGKDGIPPLFFKRCEFIIARPLWLIFNQSLSSGRFPAKWKGSIISPVFKAGDKSDVTNCRPISLLNIMGKIFEGIVTKNIYAPASHSLIWEQHGFLAGRSTCSNLAVFCNFVSRAMKNGL